MYFALLMILIEVIVVTALNYATINTYVSLDVLYCLPIIQAARMQALHTKRKDDLLLPLIFGFVIGAIWSLAEALLNPSDFPLGALALNVFSRGATFTLLGKIMAQLWKDKEYGRKDFLTDLSNPQDLLEHFAQIQRRSELSRKPYTMLYVSLVHFGRLNEELGRQAGNNALHKMAEILRSISRSVDMVARISSAQFVLLLPETDAQVAEVIKKRIITTAAKEFHNCGWNNLSVSIGLATHIGHNGSAEELLDEIMAASICSETSGKTITPAQG